MFTYSTGKLAKATLVTAGLPFGWAEWRIRNFYVVCCDASFLDILQLSNSVKQSIFTMVVFKKVLLFHASIKYLMDSTLNGYRL